MAGYGAFQRSRKSPWSRRSSTRIISGSRSIGYRKKSYGRKRALKKPRFAMVGYTRDTELKYWDKAIRSTVATLVVSPSGGTGTSSAGQSSGSWNGAQLPGGSSNATPVAGIQDLLKGVPQGMNATSRVGNVINVRYLKGNIGLTANYVTNATTGFENAQYGEGIVDDEATVLYQYLRTTYRVCVVRDLQVNSGDPNITWGQVFGGLNGVAGVYSELNVANMGRFRVLMDRVVELKADEPTKVIPFEIRNVGTVRYNGPNGENEAAAFTDTGIYVIWANVTTGVTGTVASANMRASSVLVNSRMCFTDA